jgi:hypothetical protein
MRDPATSKKCSRAVYGGSLSSISSRRSATGRHRQASTGSVHNQGLERIPGARRDIARGVGRGPRSQTNELTPFSRRAWRTAPLWNTYHERCCSRAGVTALAVRPLLGARTHNRSRRVKSTAARCRRGGRCAACCQGTRGLAGSSRHKRNHETATASTARLHAQAGVKR